MGLLEVVVLRLVMWVLAPLALLILAIGPKRARRWHRQFWDWLLMKRRDPESILTQVVRRQEKHIAALRAALARSETAERDIVRNISKSNENISSLENEAQAKVAADDDLGARAALYKLNLERRAVECFQAQLAQQRQQITDARRRLHLLELQLRQYEVGRSILLSKLAEAQSVEQQFAIAKNFDPFSAVANWQQAEGMVQEKEIHAKAAERVYSDIVDNPIAGPPVQIDAAELDAQLTALRETSKRAGVRPTEPGEKVKAKHERNGRES